MANIDEVRPPDGQTSPTLPAPMSNKPPAPASVEGNATAEAREKQCPNGELSADDNADADDTQSEKALVYAAEEEDSQSKLKALEDVVAALRVSLEDKNEELKTQQSRVEQGEELKQLCQIEELCQIQAAILNDKDVELDELKTTCDDLQASMEASLEEQKTAYESRIDALVVKLKETKKQNKEALQRQQVESDCTIRELEARVVAITKSNEEIAASVEKPPGQLRYTEEEALKIYEEGKVIGFYEHEIMDDLKCAKLIKMELPRDYDERSRYINDKQHEKGAYQRAVQAAKLVMNAEWASAFPEMDKRVLKRPSLVLHEPIVTLDRRDSVYWSTFDKVGREVSEEPFRRLRRS